MSSSSGPDLVVSLFWAIAGALGITGAILVIHAVAQYIDKDMVIRAAITDTVMGMTLIVLGIALLWAVKRLDR